MHAPLVLGCALALLSFACKSGEDGETDDAHTTTSGGTDSSTSETSTSETTSTESDGTDSTTTTTDSGGGSFYAGPDPDLPPNGAWEEDLDDREIEPPLPNHGARYRLRP